MKPMLVAALALTAAACSGGKTVSSALPPDQAKQLLINRNWIDRLPQKVDDKLHVYRFVPSMGGGVFQDRTIFFGTFELFVFEQDGQRIRFNLLHTGEKKTSTFAIEALDKPGPEGVDLKLTISDDPRGSKTYYGWRKETQDLDGQLAHLFDSLRH
jgi:hypothetical protein